MVIVGNEMFSIGCEEDFKVVTTFDIGFKRAQCMERNYLIISPIFPSVKGEIASQSKESDDDKSP